jgi:hypothetical protein
MTRLLFATGQNSPSQTPTHFGIITAGSLIKAWHADHGAIHINQARFRLVAPTCIAITSTHLPIDKVNSTNTPLMAIGTRIGLIHIISLVTGELIQTFRQMDEPNTPKNGQSLIVRDLTWSKDGNTLYSTSIKHVYQWHIGNKFAQSKRLNVFASLRDASQHNGIGDELKRDLNPDHQSIRRIAINHNQDKLILGTTGSIYVYCLVTASILAKYTGFLGRIDAISVDTAPHNYDAQYHHDQVQKNLKKQLPHNPISGHYTEFFIVASTKEDQNASIYQFPPVNVPDNKKIVISHNVKKNQKDTTHASTPTTSTFTICTQETASCPIPDGPLTLQLSVIYDRLCSKATAEEEQKPSTSMGDDDNNNNDSAATQESKSNAFMKNFPLISSYKRPNMILTAATYKGGAVVFNIPAGEDVSQIAGKSKKNKDIKDEGDKLANLKKTFVLTTFRAKKPKSIIHDPTITNNNRVLDKQTDSTTELSGSNKTKNIHHKLKKQMDIKIFAEGSVNNAYLLNLGQICVVRNSTLRPHSEIIELIERPENLSLDRFLYPQLEEVSNGYLKYPQHIALSRALAAWNGTIGLPKFVISANKDLLLNRLQDKLLLNAVRNATNKGNQPTLLLAGIHQGSLTSMNTTDKFDENNLTDEQKKNKKQKLLQHASKLNASLRNILEENQNKIGLLALTPAYKPYQVQDGTPFSDLTQLQGTLCGLLVQALRTHDDSAIEHVIKLGVQGLDNPNGWSTLVRLLNDPNSFKTHNTSHDEDELDDEEVYQTQISKHGSVGSRLNSLSHNSSSKGLGKTLIRTVHLLPTQFLQPFVNVLADKLTASPLRAYELLPWLHVILRLHTLHLLNSPAFAPRLNQIALLIKQRTQTMETAVQLKGRVEVIMTQFNNAANTSSNRGGLNSKKESSANGYVPLNFYSEDDDQTRFHSLPDTYDDPYAISGPKKRKRDEVNNFESSSLSFDSLLGDDDDEEEEDEDQWDGEGEFDPNMYDVMGNGEGEYDMFGLDNEGDELDDVDENMFDDAEGSDEVGDDGDDDDDDDDDDEDDFDLSDDDL